jgi:hypothetical protein
VLTGLDIQQKQHIESAVLLSAILDAADSQKATLLGLLNMSAAFDTVDFEIQLHRLEVSYMLSRTVLKWIVSFSPT